MAVVLWKDMDFKLCEGYEEQDVALSDELVLVRKEQAQVLTVLVAGGDKQLFQISRWSRGQKALYYRESCSRLLWQL